jgi:hypothetical protein
MRKIEMKRRDALFMGALGGALSFTLAGARAAEDDKPLPKTKIGPPPADAGKGDDENKAEEELRASEMVGLQLRVVKPGQVVTQEYNERRLTVTVDKTNTITDIRVG